MDGESWKRRIERAASIDEVVTLIQAYLDSRAASELELLPSECPMPHPVNAETTEECALRLARFHCHGDTARIVQRFAAVFTAAAVRLGELRRDDSR